MSASEKQKDRALSEEKRELLELLLEEEGFRVPSPSIRTPGDATYDLVPELPRIVPAPGDRYQPFPLTDIQQAYWIGRSMSTELGGNVALHGYLELESAELDLERLATSWRQVVDRHDMLRVIVQPDGQQRILERVPPYQLEVLDLRGRSPDETASQLETLRQRLSHEIFPMDRWPQFDIRASRLDEQGMRLHISFDATNVDFGSFMIIFKDWVHFYEHPEAVLPPLELSYRDYVLAMEALRKSDLYQRSVDYWQERVASLPLAPQLPLAKNPAALTPPRFVSRSARLPTEAWRRLRTRATQAGLTPSGVVLAAYAEVLAEWSEHSPFTINVTLFNRLPLHPQVNEIAGDFTSIILLGVENQEGATFEDRARRLQRRLWEGFENRYVSGVQVLRELARRQGRISGALMPVVFTSTLGFNLGENPLARLGNIVYSITQTPQVWLDHQVYEDNDDLVLKWDALEELFPAGLLDDMLDAHLRLLRHLANDSESWKVQYQLLPAWQLNQRATINDTRAPIPEETIYTLFESQASRRPDQSAIVSSRRTLTYAELFRASQQVGRRLRDLGARPDTLAAVVMEKGWEQAVAVLGIVASGAAYLPIDPRLPQEPLQYLLENGEVRLALTQSWVDARLEWPESIQRLCIDNLPFSMGDDEPLGQWAKPASLAYVLYTSGSTGSPKGVMIEHRGVVNRILDVNHRFSVGSHDRVLALTALHHDLSVYDVFGTLAAGGTIIMPDASAIRDPVQWVDFMAMESVTVWNSVPAFMEMLVEYAEHLSDREGVLPRSLRLALLAGDWIPVTLPNRIRALAEGIQVVSLGGPTETTIWDICYPIQSVDSGWNSVPYGKPMVNARYHILNGELEPCPVWVPGQLYIGGCGLARGYWRDEEKTRASFTVHPETGERLYRSGDLGRYLPDGNIEFLGREDFQVKIQGHRIELGEIEAAVRKHERVRNAIATTVEEQGKKRLVAYIVPDPEQKPSTSELHSFLNERLPAHMVPSAYVFLDALPLSSNGKVDRRALPHPVDSTTAPVQETYAEASAITLQIAKLVAEVLGREQVDPATNLLQLGANSIDIVRIGNQLETAFGFRPKIEDMFRLPTVAALGAYYQERMSERQGSPAESEGVGDPALKSYLASVEMVLDPRERERFKDRQIGLRTVDGEPSYIQLLTPKIDEAFGSAYTARRSHRQFSLKPVPFEQFSRLLGCLYRTRLNEQPKYLYASAGGLYPVQTYFHLKPGRIESLSGGTYYYHPVDHRLIVLSANVDLDRSIHVPFINQPVFDEAAFSIFFVAQLSAIAPIYADRSLHYATLEAGGMAHLLEITAPSCQLGLCQIGAVDFARIRPLFGLEDSHCFIHSMLGGLREAGQETGLGAAQGGESGELERVARMLKKIGELSGDEVKALLEANRSLASDDGKSSE